MVNPFSRSLRSVLTGLATASILFGSIAGSASAVAATTDAMPSSATSSCHLASTQGKIKHVIYLQFDNTHFTRDNPNVPSDLEQMPNLLNFITSNGTMLANQHTPLIAHTATDILTSLTGVYGDQHGVPIGNSFRYFNPDGTSTSAGSFAYWASPVNAFSQPATDTTYNMLTQSGTNAPAPWVPFTRAGCNFGAVGMANIDLENTAPDVGTVFGAGSPQAQEAQSNPTQASADFVGISIHCAAGDALCSTANTGIPDVLPNEPKGYTGFNALHGHKYVAPLISPNGPLTDLTGQPITGFPGFGALTPQISLSYVAAMQEQGVPVTFAYVTDAHASSTGKAYGPGEAGYVSQLKTWDAAFGSFFSRLAADGINQQNTLFVITADEGDHFVGGAANPAKCDGVTTPCTYSQIGELNTNVTGLLATQQNVTSSFAIHSDMAPTFYLNGNPVPTDPSNRSFVRATSALTVTNLMTGASQRLTNYLADPLEMGLLHMVTADPARTPTFTMFANPDYFVTAGPSNCTSPCVTQNPSFAWNHGGVSPDINVTWLGLVGPGVNKVGVTSDAWSDQTDIRPTMLALLGLKDDYSRVGRVLFEVLDPRALPPSFRAHPADLLQLAQVYKQLNAPVGQFGLSTLSIATAALESGTSTDDSTYTLVEGQLASFGSQRDALTAQMSAMLEGVAVNNQPIDAKKANQLIEQGTTLLNNVTSFAAGYPPSQKSSRPLGR